MSEKPVVVTSGGTYHLYKYQNEKELEQMIVEHSHEIFGKQSRYFNLKRKISSRAGSGTIPDGYAIDFKENKFYIIEVELVSHSVKRHIQPQIINFITALENERTIQNLIGLLYDELPPAERISKDRLESIIRNWEIIIIIDDVADPMKDISLLQESLNVISKLGPVRAIPFQTYCKNGTITDDHVHSFRSFTKEELQQEAKKWTFKWESVSAEKQLEKTPDDLKELFLELGSKICCIAPEIKEVHRKKWTTYQLSALKNFCSIKTKSGFLEINLKVDKSIFSDSKGIANSIERTAAWTFDKVFDICSEKEIDYAIKLIEQSYKSMKK